LFRFALVSLIVFGGTTGATLGQRHLDCAAAYQTYLEELKHKRMSSQRRAALYRWALRVYDACETGDLEVDVEELDEVASQERCKWRRGAAPWWSMLGRCGGGLVDVAGVSA